MSRDERIAALLEGYTLDDRRRLRPAAFAADYLGVSLASVYRISAEGRLGSVKLDGRDRGRTGRAGGVRFRLEDLVAYVVDREVAAVAPLEAPVSTRRAAAHIVAAGA